ncbi:signal peptidase I [Nocardioides caricicola]|uniref:Signal peptidase I n=1 Tax=Nocardioides caricicola TaxID=634770 RepID=A0ABW0N973_9ACTN
MAKQVALTVGAVAGVLCIAVMLAGFAFGVRPLVFLSGSMSPAIDTGALAIARHVPAADLSTGDIVSVPTPAGQRVTHRIVEVQHDDGSATLLLKGDANEVVDATPYRVAGADVVLFSVPEVGYVLSWLASPVGLFSLGLYAAVLLSVLVRRPAPAPARRRAGAPQPGRHRATVPVLAATPVAPALVGRHRLGGPRRRSHRSPVLVLARSLVPARRTGGGHRKAEVRRTRSRRPALALPITAATVVAGGWVAGSAESTLAAFVDPATASGTTQTAYTVPAPNGNTCTVLTPGTNTSRGVNLTWPDNVASLPRLAYTASTNLTGATSNAVDLGTTWELRVRYNPSTTANQNKIVTVTAAPRLATTASWTGPTTSWKFRTGSTAAAQPVCGDATPAVVAIRAPDGATRTPTAQRAFISGATGCTADIGFCGTIEDASTISTVTYVLRRDQGGTIRCFNGTSWVVSCTAVTALSTTYNNQLTFYEDATTATVYPNTGTGSYTLTVTVTDSWQNVTTSAVSFTLN